MCDSYVVVNSYAYMYSNKFLGKKIYDFVSWICYFVAQLTIKWENMNELIPESSSKMILSNHMHRDT